MVCARSAAMSFNRLADRELDRLNPRTRGRHLPAGLLTVRSVAVFAAVAALGFVAATTLFLPNRLPLYAFHPGARIPVGIQLYEAIHVGSPFLVGGLA